MSHFTPISFENEGGSIEGYFHLNTSENIYNYFEEHSVPSEMISFMKDQKEIFVVGLIRNFWVDEDMRNQGYGSELFDKAVSTLTENCDLVFLISDTADENNFDLTKWYESFGFETLYNTASGPLMVIGSEDLINLLRASIHPSPILN